MGLVKFRPSVKLHGLFLATLKSRDSIRACVGPSVCHAFAFRPLGATYALYAALFLLRPGSMFGYSFANVV